MTTQRLLEIVGRIVFVMRYQLKVDSKDCPCADETPGFVTEEMLSKWLGTPVNEINSALQAAQGANYVLRHQCGHYLLTRTGMVRAWRVKVQIGKIRAKRKKRKSRSV